MILLLFERAIQFLFASYLSNQIAPKPDGSIGPVATLQLTNKQIQPDDFPRPASLINGVFPAPVITAQKGEAFDLTVENMLMDNTMHRPTSIHWHGVLHRSGSHHADGAIGVTQCPISPGKSFRYQFLAAEAGTFWYHSHYSTQYCDGVRGAMVVYDPQDPYKANGTYDVDDASTVLTLADWYHFQSPSLGHFPGGDSTLFNGKGRYPGKPTADLFVLRVEKGKKYRLRLISVACDPAFTFSIDGHSLTVLEADADLVVPLANIEFLEIFPGQRYSVILNANDPQNVGNYWIRGQPDAGNNGLPDTFFNGVNSAILRYTGAQEVFPTTEENRPTETNFLKEENLHALINPKPPGYDNGTVDLPFNFKIGYDKKTETFTLNGATFVPDLTNPILLQILRNPSVANKILPPSSVYRIPRNKSVSITLSGDPFDGPHPFHLHGHAFSVVQSAGSKTRNLINPVRRDTTSFGVQKNEGEEGEEDHVEIRFKTDNPGPWIFHCHIDWHLERGMAIVFVEDEPSIKTGAPPPEWTQLCTDFATIPPDMTRIVTVPPPFPTPFPN